MNYDGGDPRIPDYAQWIIAGVLSVVIGVTIFTFILALRAIQ